MKYSFIVTAFREEDTIAELIRRLIPPDIELSWELIVVVPDKGTKDVATKTATELGLASDQFRLLTDEGKGKPAALNLALKKAQGEWLILTDGDVVLKESASAELLKALEIELELDNEHGEAPGYRQIGGLSGRPVSADDRSGSLLSYWGHLLAAAAHHKRTLDLTNNPVGLSTRLVPKREFFPLSGYLLAIRNLKFVLPEDCLADDAYLSYVIFNAGYRISYVPHAEVAVKYPANLTDYFAQKKRSTGGYVQLWKYGVVSTETKSRSFWRELEYFWFPIKYAANFRELIWSLALYPTRLWLWLRIYWERKIMQKDFAKTWVRIESTK